MATSGAWMIDARGRRRQPRQCSSARYDGKMDEGVAWTLGKNIFNYISAPYMLLPTRCKSLPYAALSFFPPKTLTRARAVDAKNIPPPDASNKARNAGKNNNHTQLCIK
jgi:hypothetical protein